MRGEFLSESKGSLIEDNISLGNALALASDWRNVRPPLAVRPEGANHQWRKNPPGELSIDPVADERLVRVIFVTDPT